MKYVITGATSFIGLELIELLLSQHHYVVAVCRPDSKGLAKIPPGVEIVLAEMADYGDLHKDIASADVFVNLAWEGTGHDGRNEESIQHGNVIHTIAAMFAADRMGCKVFVEAGSQAEYGTVTTMITENNECRPFSSYGKAKLEVKNQLFKLSEQLGIKYIHLRIFSLYGENDHPWTLIMSSIDKMLHNEPVDLSSCTQKWNFLYVADAVRQIVGLVDFANKNPSFRHEIYNIASKDTRELRDFVLSIRTLCQSDSTLNFGKISPEHIVSLNPDVSKTEAVVEVIDTTRFEDIIKVIIQKKLQLIINDRL